MWVIKKCSEKDTEGIDSILEEGYEPFAVTVDNYGEVVWFKKELLDDIVALVKERMEKVVSTGEPEPTKVVLHFNSPPVGKKSK